MGAEARSVVVRLTAETAQYIAQMQAAGRLSATAMQPAEAAVMRQSAAIDDLGGKAGKLGLAAAVGLGAMGKAAIDWESQWAGVEKTVDGTTAQLDGLEDDLRGLATAMPATHQEIAATAEAAGQLGVETPNIRDFTKVMVEMGETTNLASEDAATSIAQFMNVMQTMPDQVDEIGNTIVDLGNKGASTESQITDMAQRVAGAGTTIGATESDVLGLSAAMANLGIQSELGGGAVQRVLLGINTSVASGSEKVEEYARIAGTSADEFADAWRASPIEAFDLLVQGLGRVQAEGGDVASVLGDMGIKGTQNLQVMLRLAGSGDMLTKSLQQSRDAWEQNDALTTEYGKRAETTASQVQVAWNRIKDAAIEGGAATLPVIADMADKIGDVADWYGGMPPIIQDITGAGLALTAVLGGGLWFGAKVIGGITSTKASLAALRPEIARVGTDLIARSGVRQFTSDLMVMASTSRTAGATTEREMARTAAASQRLRGQLKTVGVRGGALIAGLTLATTDLADGMGLSNTMSMALMGTIAGPWGAAIGGGIGLIKDFRAASKDASSVIDAFNDSLDDTDISKMLSAFTALQSKTAETNDDLHELSGVGDLIGDSLAGWGDVFGDGLTDLQQDSAAATDQLVNLTGVLQGVAQANNDFIATATGENGWSNLPYGDLEDLARIGSQVQPVLDELGYSLDDLMSMKPGSDEAVKAVQEINDALASANSHEADVDALGSALDGLGNDMLSTAENADALKDSLDALLSPGMDLAAATDEWRAGIRNFADELDETGRSLTANTDAADKNRAAIRGQVSNLQDLLVAQSQNGASSDKLAQTMRRGRKAILDAGEAAGLSRKEMRDYLDVLGLTPDLVKTVIQADTGQAREAITSVGSWLESLDGKTARTYIKVIQQGYTDKRGAFDIATGSAEGSTVPKTGRGYADRHLYLLADGEEVISNRYGQADRHRSLLKAINANMLAGGGTAGMVPGLAAGGSVADARVGSATMASADWYGLTLTTRQYAAAMRASEKGLKAELSMRQKLLEREVDREERLTDAARDHVQAIRDDIKSVRSSIAERFRSDVFGQEGNTLDLASNRPDNWAEMSAEQQKAWLDTMWRVQQSTAQSADPLAVLKGDIADAREAKGLYDELEAIFRASGGKFTKAERQALLYAQQNASLDELAALAGDSDLAQQYARLYGKRQEVTTATGNTAAMQRWGDAQVSAVKELQAAKAELKESNKQLKAVTAHLAKIEKNTKDAPEKTGKSVGDSLNSTAGKSSRKGSQT